MEQAKPNLQSLVSNLNAAFTNIRQVIEGSDLKFEKHQQLQKDMELIGTQINLYLNLIAPIPQEKIAEKPGLKPVPTAPDDKGQVGAEAPKA